jgi:hypothetical protein
MSKQPNETRLPKIARAYVANLGERADMAAAANIKITDVRCAAVVGENIRDPQWKLRAGELLAVNGLEALGQNRQDIAAAVAWVQAQGAEVIEISTGERAGHGVGMLNRALSRIHGTDRIKSKDAAKEMQRKGVASRTKDRMPKEQAEPHWRNLRLTSVQALAKMTGWSRPTAYNTFGKRDRTPGRPNKKGEGRIYFVRPNGKGPVKIGYATNVNGRLKGLQTSHHRRLVMVGLIAGTHAEEQALHKRFRKYRLEGEWFAYKDELKDYIEALPKWDGEI